MNLETLNTFFAPTKKVQHPCPGPGRPPQRQHLDDAGQTGSYGSLGLGGTLNPKALRLGFSILWGLGFKGVLGYHPHTFENSRVDLGGGRNRDDRAQGILCVRFRWFRV